MAVWLSNFGPGNMAGVFGGFGVVSFVVIAALIAVIVRLSLRARQQRVEWLRERRMREEMEAYAKLDTVLLLGRATGDEIAEDERALARRVCKTVAQNSLFDRIAMLLRGADGKLYCAASVGIDDLTATALRGWGDQIAREELLGDPIRSLTTGTGRAFGSFRVGQRSFALQLGPWEAFDPGMSLWKSEGKRERRQFRRAIAIPMRSRSGQISGVLVVCGELSAKDRSMGIERAIAPLEMLILRLGAAIESLTLSERLLRAEKLAALGQLAEGVAHALNNPLTAVLGFGELIAETSDEQRVRRDAGTIVLEARKMRDTIQQLIDFWRPGKIADEPVDVGALIRDLADRCASRLEQRDIRLDLSICEQPPDVRGDRRRISQVLEHLLNNAAHAVSIGPPVAEGGSHTIRVTLSHGERGLHIIVADTGPGFPEPARVFDPFFTTRQVGQGSGLGLSVCYSIVREHGGEINAFNLYPHGGAVIVDLPVRKAAQNEDANLLIREVA